MAFVKGQSGNPGGRPKIAPEVQELLKDLTPEAVTTLAEIMRNAKAQAPSRVAAAVAILRKSLPDLQAVQHKGDEDQPFKMEISWKRSSE